jgi:rubrerythrin
MATTYVTKATGGRARMTPMTVVEPEQQMTHGSFDTVATDITGDKVFLAGMLSAFCAMERCGVHLYRTVAARTGIDDWRQHYETFGRQTEDHVRILEDLIGRIHGDRQYVSPAARLEEARNAKLMEVPLLGGCADGRLQELTDLETVIAAEQKCHGNWALLKHLATRLPQGDTRHALETAVAQVEDQEAEHVRWATETWRETMIRICQETPV